MSGSAIADRSPVQMSWITPAVNRPVDNPDSAQIDYVTVGTAFVPPRVNINADSPYRDANSGSSCRLAVRVS